MRRSTINLICVKYSIQREMSRDLCSQLLQLTQDIITQKISKYLSNKRGGSTFLSVKKGLVKSQHDLLTEIASHL